MEPIVEALVALIERHGWRPAFEEALDAMARHDVRALASMRTLDDYLAFVDDLARWAPREDGDSRRVHDRMVEFHFVLDQAPLRALQSPVAPGSGAAVPTPLSAWMRAFARRWGEYLDTAASAVHVDSFRTNPAFHWDDYLPPPSGYRTFNQFFARHVRPGMRPVAAIADPRVLVSPADAVFIGSWHVDGDETIRVEDGEVDARGLRWSIRELLAHSDHAHRFAGGTFMHCALRTYDYHRWHAPLPGRVVEVRSIEGQVWLDVEAVPAMVDGRRVNVLHAIEGTGYQFVQQRALVILETPHGLVACVPVGMGHVSSVVVTAMRGITLHKGEEMGYFQFGGSDFVLVFERDCQVELTCRAGVHYLQGSAIGRLHG